METIKLDLIPGKKMPSLHASQYDDGREHGIDLFENGVAYKLDGTETLTINECKGDDCICSLDIENTFADTNHIEFASTEQMCAVWGNNLCELVIVKGEVSIGTLNFILEVEPSPTENGIESESEINNLRRQVNEMVDEEMGDYLLKTEAEETYATITALETLSGVVDTKASKTYVDNVVSPKADKTYVDTELDNKANKSNTYTKTEVDTLIDNLPEPMIFKGTLGVGGTIQTLPTASASNEGWTYKVITDGTYAGQTAKAGDVFTSSGSEWVLIPSADEDNDTWRAIKINGVEKLGNAISSGSADFVGSENIDVEFDSNGNKIGIKTKNIYTKAEVNEIIYDVLPSDVVSGSVANFETDLALPLKSMEIEVNATQEAGTPTPSEPKVISGVSAVNIFHRGANLWNEVWEAGDLDGRGVNIPDNTSIRSKDFIQIPPNTAFYCVAPSAYGRARYYDKDKNYLGSTDKSGLRYIGKTVCTMPANAYYLRFAFTTASGEGISVNYPSTDTEYHAYNGNTEVINLGGTYYGGYVSQDKNGKRELVVTWKHIKISDITNWYFDSFGNANAQNISDLPTGVEGEKPDIISEVFETVIYSNRISYSNAIITVINNAKTIYIRNHGTQDVTEFLQTYGDYYICYRMTEPIIIPLADGEPIITLNGTNNIYADSGDTAVEFKESINQKIASLQALLLST